MDSRILLVDDEAPVLIVYGDMLRRLGFIVDAVETKAEAESLLKKYKYCGAVLDLQLSAQDLDEGLELSRLARELQDNLTIIILTAYGNSETRKQAEELGVNYYFEKPVSTRLILSALGRVDFP